jgi:hypothetical protein
MKGLLVVVVLLLAGVVGLACYRGWVHFSTNGGEEKPNVTLEVDKNKIEADKEKVEGLGQRATDKSGSRTDTAKEQERRP